MRRIQVYVALLLGVVSFGILGETASARRPLAPTGHAGGYLPPYRAASHSGTWTILENAFPGHRPDTALLLTDGTVLMHDECTPKWYRLSADANGSYVTGTWT